MTLPPWEALVLGGAALSGPLAGYLLGRLHAHVRQGQRDRERAFSALGGKPDWEARADAAEAAAVKHSQNGAFIEASQAMDVASRIRHDHKGDR